jgi:hypothetical protein
MQITVYYYWVVYRRERLCPSCDKWRLQFYCIYFFTSLETLAEYTFRQLPLGLTATFFGRFCCNLQGIWRMVKTQFLFFWLSIKWKIIKIFAIEIEVFLTVYVYSDIEIDQILKSYRNQSVGSKSVEMFGLSLTVFELKAFKFSNELTVRTNSVMAYLEKIQVSTL